MRYYETMYIVNPNLDSKVLKAILDDVKKELDKTKSEIINHYNWGKKRLAYQIENQKYGSYIIIQYGGGDKLKMTEFDTWMKLNNAIIRHMTVLLDSRPDLYIEEEKVEDKKEEKEEQKEEEKVEQKEEEKVEQKKEEKVEQKKEKKVEQKKEKKEEKK